MAPAVSARGRNGVSGAALATAEPGPAVRFGGAVPQRLHAAVHGWYEGHIQGEDVCPGCDFWGTLPKGSRRL